MIDGQTARPDGRTGYPDRRTCESDSESNDFDTLVRDSAPPLEPLAGQLVPSESEGMAYCHSYDGGDAQVTFGTEKRSSPLAHLV